MEMAAVVEKAQPTDNAATVEKGSLTDTSLLDDDDVRYKRLLRKIDWRLMPLMCIIYGIQFIDKTTLSYASVMGIKTDTHLVGDQYSLLGTMFYIGYLVSHSKLPMASSPDQVGLGIPYQLFHAETTLGKIPVRQHRHLGSHPRLYGCVQELDGSHARSNLSGSLRGHCHPRIRSHHITVVPK